MRTVVVFDFDGTLTIKDTFVEFIVFSKGFYAYYFGLFILSPILILYFLKIIPNYKAKQIVFSYFFKGIRIEEFNEWTDKFKFHIDKILNNGIFKEFNKHIEEGKEVIIVSASIESWIEPWAKKYNISKVLSTEIEIKDNTLTGHFRNKNCYGDEKLIRLLDYLEIQSRDEIHITVYGDSDGDKAMLNYADIALLIK